ncbi:MAG: S8 family serine peptidase, partial [Dermatophilaceae bacterium]
MTGGRASSGPRRHPHLGRRAWQIRSTPSNHRTLRARRLHRARSAGRMTWWRRLAPDAVPLTAALALLLAHPAAAAAVAAEMEAAAETAPACATATGVFRDEPTPVQRYHGARSLWSATTGQGVTVALLSTGIDRNNLQLSGRVPGPGVDVVDGQPSRADLDCDGDGTFAAGVIAAVPFEGSSFHGIAPGVSLLPIRVAQTVRVEGTDRVELAGGGPAEIAAGIRAATAAGARIICVTATTSEDSPELRAAVGAAVAAGSLVVSGATVAPARGGSAGGRAEQPPQFPSAYADVLAVGATSLDGQPIPTSPQGAYIDLLAPAQGVVSTAPVADAGRAGHTAPADDPAAATAAVAAGAALILAADPQSTQQAVRERLVGTAVLPARLAGGTTGAPRVLDLDAAVNAEALAPRRPAPLVLARPRPVSDRLGELDRRVLSWTGSMLLLTAVAGVTVALRRRPVAP